MVKHFKNDDWNNAYEAVKLPDVLESGKRFKLPSGETFDQLRQPLPSSATSTESTSPEKTSLSLAQTPVLSMLPK
jgi:hypothetical protein